MKLAFFQGCLLNYAYLFYKYFGHDKRGEKQPKSIVDCS